ncbi:uncharacterized protein [Trachinotus anak]|uniref:uncharacterized protein n=1 Tax=Trachinotus anak TaxID=443729 RepID=UPI0039F1CF1A
MYHSSLLLCLSLGALVKYAAGSDWCYNGCEHTPSEWDHLDGSFCGEKRQSPINIITSHVEMDPNLTNFNFVNFSSRHVIKSYINNGHTAKYTLEENTTEVSGGGLNATYSTIQFHFHWGDTEYHPGSEHTIDGHRYPMEMHIVSLKKGLSVEQAKVDSAGIAVLGFFISAKEDGNVSAPWGDLVSNLTSIKDNEVPVNYKISLDDLIGSVNLTKFYRYMGSLTTPDCSEAVVWTIFHEPINIHKNLIRLFPMNTGLSNVFRPVQDLHKRQVFASPATPLPTGHPWCYDEHHCACTPPLWHFLPDSHCDGERQSPIDIVTKKTVIDEHLDAFTYTKFDDKHAIKYITNTGHSVKCVLKEDMVEVSGGGLGYVYSTLQFHFHWGDTSHESTGSEHTVDSKRYPMEMHIVNKRKDLTLDEAINTPNGLAVLGFFIEPTDSTKIRSSSGSSSEHHETNPTSSQASDMEAWTKLTKHLSDIQNLSSEVIVTEEISIDDLLGNVNRASYYRYNGSLTTPSCNEAVVWTVFKESVKVDQDLMMLFPIQTGHHNVFRPTQSLHNRTIYSTMSAASAPEPTALFLLLACLCAFPFNFHL